MKSIIINDFVILANSQQNWSNNDDVHEILTLLSKHQIFKKMIH